jgi:hypothetical protein
MPVRRPEYDTSESYWASAGPRILSYPRPAHCNFHSYADRRSFASISSGTRSWWGLKKQMCVTGTWAPRSKVLPPPTICIDYSSDTTAPKSWRVGVAAFHAELTAANVVIALSLSAAMQYALWCARYNCHRLGMRGVSRRETDMPEGQALSSTARRRSNISNWAAIGRVTSLSFARYFPRVFTRVNIVYTVESE